MNITNNANCKGFSLIEIMLAVLILSIGILAVSKLQGSLLKSGSDSNERSVAASLVQRKADDLRRFIHITTSESTVADTWSGGITSPLSIAYKHIETNKGGLIAASDITIANTVYSLAWSVKDYYYASTDSQASTTPSAAAYPSFKMAHITAKWDSASSTNNVVSFDTIIEAYDPVSTSLDASSTIGGTGPVIPYDPQQQPDVVPITLNVDGTKKETTKPLPDLSKKGYSTLVKFETVSYSSSLDTVKREEFQTLVCRCSGSTTEDTQIYGLTTWDNSSEKIVDITTTRHVSISKRSVDDGGGESQNPLCFTCCEDGNEVAGSNFKVCRTKRIDGILRMFDPWKMIAFNVIPATYFNDSSGKAGMTTTVQQANIDLYSTYTASLVRNVLTANTNPSAFSNYTTVDNTFKTAAGLFVNGIIDHTSFDQNTGQTIQARAIYLDYPPTGIYSIIENQSTSFTVATVPLDRIPFYEVNMTELAGWVPDPGNTTSTFVTPYTSQHTDSNCSNTINCVTNEILDDAGAYSRGEFNAKKVETRTVKSRIFTSSDGVINRDITLSPANTVSESSADLTVH